jgi:hypothetical protein
LSIAICPPLQARAAGKFGPHGILYAYVVPGPDLPTLTAAAAAPTGVDGTRMRSWSATDQDRCRAPWTRRRTASIRSVIAVAGNKYAASPDRYTHQPFSRSHSHTPGPVHSCVSPSAGAALHGRQHGRWPIPRSPARRSPQQVLNLYSAPPQTVNAAQMSIWYMCRSVPSTAESQRHSPVRAHFQRQQSSAGHFGRCFQIDTESRGTSRTPGGSVSRVTLSRRLASPLLVAGLSPRRMDGPTRTPRRTPIGNAVMAGQAS